MNVNFQIVNRAQADLFQWIPPVDVAYIAGQPLLPLHAGELAAAASTMPLAIVQRDGGWELVAVAGLQPQHNLFVKNGEWLGRYQPRSVATYDFDLQSVGDMAVLRFNRHGKLAASAGQLGAESLLDAEGNLTPAVQAIQSQLQQDTPLFKRTQVAVQALVDAKVLMPWPDTFKAQLGLQLEGLHCVNEAALAQLPEADFLVLRQKQALGIAYALNLSLQQGHLLLRLQKHNPAVDTPADVDALFGNKGGDDTIHFGF